jgi:hypothetical protein
VPSPPRSAGTSSWRPIGLPGEESRGLLEGLPYLLQAAVSRRRQRSSSRSSVVRPSRRPESTSRRTQLRSDRGDQPSSAAICGIEWPELRTSSTATPELERLRGTGTWH